MPTLNMLVLVCLLYVALLFFVAFAADRAALRGRGKWLGSPIVYTLSLSIYCTAWTFYGAVGFAARSGLEFVTIYLGPTLVMIGWWWVLRKMVRVGQSQRITSIADLISSRYGKSNSLAVVVTLLAVVGTTPYIALQLQSVTLSFAAFAETGPDTASSMSQQATGFWLSLGLALFTILFGTRNLDANERHHGVVMAIALEAVVKLFALLAVGVFVVWGLAGGVSETLARIDASEIAEWNVSGSRWIGLTALSAAAFLCLPRMFQVMVVENENEDHLRTAAWAFPAYLMLMSLFVVPIAAVGLDLLPKSTNPDLFVLSLPLAEGREGLAILSFLGGFSSATSMVIVAAIALSTMVSNHIVMPIWLNMTGGLAQTEDLLIMAQRIMGGSQAQTFFARAAERQGIGGYLPEPSPDFLQELERELSGSVGAAAAHAMVGQIVGGASVSVEDLMAVADETAQIMEYSSKLEAKSTELTRTARQLREANEKLTQLSRQKDAFLSQVSHELRTPMTSIRAFSEILRDSDALKPAESSKYASVIHDEAIRLTRLLDDLLDLSVLESGQVSLNLQSGTLGDLLDRATASAGGGSGDLDIRRKRTDEDVLLSTDLDRLAQVFINLIANARKYCDASNPSLTISTRVTGETLLVDFVDNGTGIPTDKQGVIFEKFSRIGDTKAGGAGLGLAICREIMARLGGQVTYLPGQGGAAFRVSLPVQQRVAAQ